MATQSEPPRDVSSSAQDVVFSPSACPAPPPTPAAVTVDEIQKSKLQSFLDDTYEHAELAGFILFVIAFLAWSVFLPKKSWYPPNPETELNERLQEAVDAAKGKTNAKTAALGFSRIEQAILVEAAYTPASPSPEYWTEVVEELRRDLVVWKRYEDELRTFRLGIDLNWYLFSSLRVIVIILSAITPALIVAPMLQNKKFLAALPAAIVAIGTGCISEFDFKTEAARYDTAFVALQGEKTSFITQSTPYYKIPDKPADRADKARTGTPKGQDTKSSSSAQDKPSAGTTASPTTDACSKSTTDGVPFPKPSNYPETRANFSCRIQQILQAQTEERDQFLRGELAKRETTPSNTANQPKK